MWIAEVIDDLAEKTNSHKLVKCYKELIKKFPKAWDEYYIAESIKFAEEALQREIENE